MQVGQARIFLRRIDLRERADELAAGLDAWTGGWWSAQLAASSPQGPTQESTP